MRGGGTVPLRLERGSILSAVVVCYINLHPECEASLPKPFQRYTLNRKY